MIGDRWVDTQGVCACVSGREVTGRRAGFCASGVDLCVRVVAVGSKRGRRFLSFALVCVLYVCVCVCVLVVVAVGWKQEGQGLVVAPAGRGLLLCSVFILTAELYISLLRAFLR